MAFRYNVNLIKEQVARADWERAMLQLVTMSLLFFAVLLVVTFAVYLWRDETVLQYRADVRLFSQQLDNSKVSKAEIEVLRVRMEETQKRLTAINAQFQGSVSWPHLLVTLEGCCDRAGVKMRKIEGKGTAQAPVIALDAECTAENPARVINAFIAEVGKTSDFGRPNLIAINKRSDLGPHIFQVDIPLNVAPQSGTAKTPKAATEAPLTRSDGGKS